MEIKVKCSCGEDKCLEWAIVELQGMVEAQPSFLDKLQNLQIGLLCRPSSQENYAFTVGYHELMGSKVPLKKPMLVLKKIKFEEKELGSAAAAVAVAVASSSKVELDVIGIIHYRILFKTRPRALISIKKTEGTELVHVSDIAPCIERRQTFQNFPAAAVLIEPQPPTKGKGSGSSAGAIVAKQI